MNKDYDQIIKNALDEDIQSGDITTMAIVSSDLQGRGEFLVKNEGIIAGLDIVERLFSLSDIRLQFKKNFADGDIVKSGQVVAIVSGSAASILTAERTALNFLQRMSGIATMANEFAEKIKHTKAKILDTRKTVPGLRTIDKLAVKIGGCFNHRFGLYDMFLIKDNHIAVAGSITKAVNLCKEFSKKNNLNSKIEVETTNLDEVNEALMCNVDFILLDNFELNEMKKAVRIIGEKCKIEASGRIDSNTIVSVAETGVDFISIGALTHSVKALDISLEVKL
jgi:nicotinate-nucleotide pyrophosphorylase (carboxylating)